MKRTTLLTLVSVTFIFILSGCWNHEKEDNSCGYCDDSGCWSCDGDYCWPVENEPCGDEDACSAQQFCADFGCANLCAVSADCNLGEICLEAGYCSAEEAPETRCAQDEDCGNGTICEFSDTLGYHICVPGCASDDECNENEVCAPCGRCVPEDNPVCGDSKVFCENSEECGTKICSIDFKCALECDMASPMCPTGQICAENVCIDDPNPLDPECVFSSQCGENAVCLNTYCHATCSIDDECGYGEFCDLGVCKADYRPELP
ncbi:hypothetical protein KKF84_19435 [Myxococcota bacterium]|nr:hypothetical protein [Myxococcota bacterium]